MKGWSRVAVTSWPAMVFEYGYRSRYDERWFLVCGVRFFLLGFPRRDGVHMGVGCFVFWDEVFPSLWFFLLSGWQIRIGASMRKGFSVGFPFHWIRRFCLST